MGTTSCPELSTREALNVTVSPTPSAHGPSDPRDVPDPRAIVLETVRLVFRRLTLDDLDRLATLYRDPDVRRYFPEGILTGEEDSGRAGTLHQRPLPPVRLRPLGDDPQGVGRVQSVAAVCCPGKSTGAPKWRWPTSWTEYWGQGLGTEAAEAIRDNAFNVLNLPRLICLTDRDNAASQNVAAKIGMRFEREGKDEKGPYLMYAMSRP